MHCPHDIPFSKFLTRLGEQLVVTPYQLSFSQIRMLCDQVTGLAATMLLQVHNDGKVHYINLYDSNAREVKPTDIFYECAAKSIGNGQYIIANRMSGQKKLVVISHGTLKLFDDLEEVDEYDQDDVQNGVEYWDNEEPMSMGPSPDTIISEYKGTLAIKSDGIYLQAP